MTFDWTVKITDIIMVFAIIVGPIAAVTITEWIRKRHDEKDRKIYIFRTLMATRSAPLAFGHVEALNLIELEFKASRRKESAVVDCWKIYVDHLNKKYNPETWEHRRGELLIDLLYALSVALGYPHTKADITRDSYYPTGYGEADVENAETRRLWLSILRGEKPLGVLAFLRDLRTEDSAPKKDERGESASSPEPARLETETERTQ